MGASSAAVAAGAALQVLVDPQARVGLRALAVLRAPVARRVVVRRAPVVLLRQGAVTKLRRLSQRQRGGPHVRCGPP